MTTQQKNKFKVGDLVRIKTYYRNDKIGIVIEVREIMVGDQLTGSMEPMTTNYERKINYKLYPQEYVWEDDLEKLG